MCQSLEDKYVLKAQGNFSWTLNYMKLKHEVYRFTHEHEEKSLALWKKKKIDRAKKVIMHGT